MHVGVLLLGPQGEIHLSNPAACVLLGRTESQLLGTIAFTTDWDVIHSDDSPFPNETFSVSQVLQTKCALHNVIVGIYRPSQDRVWVLVNAEPQLGADGSVEQVICTLSDMTERKQAESERLQLANHIKLLLESTEEGIYGIDLQGCCTFINTNGAKMIGYKPDEVIGLDMHNLIHHSYSDGSPYPNHLCLIFQAFRIGQSCRVDSEVFWRQDGTSFVAEYSSYPIIESLDIKGAVVTFRDITERRRTEEAKQALLELQQNQAQRIQTEKMSSLGQMVAGMAHEINNPVNFIYGNLQYTNEYVQNLLKLVQLYQEQYPQPTPAIQAYTKQFDLEFVAADLPRMLNSMKTGAERISSLVLSLRNFSRLDEAQVKQVDLHEGIDNTLLILNHSLETRITITKQYGDLPLVECYPAQMNLVFMNLLSNAIDALQDGHGVMGHREESSNYPEGVHPSGKQILNEGNKLQGLSHQSPLSENSTAAPQFLTFGNTHKNCEQDRQLPTIHIRTKLVDDNWVAITIADNGSGIRSQIIDKIFDPFFTTKPVGKGTGLGLAICYQIIEKHQGQISVNSQPDRGTEFVITLPIKRTSNDV